LLGMRAIAAIKDSPPKTAPTANTRSLPSRAVGGSEADTVVESSASGDRYGLASLMEMLCSALAQVLLAIVQDSIDLLLVQ
jgi:hypothetical protein